MNEERLRCLAFCSFVALLMFVFAAQASDQESNFTKLVNSWKDFSVGVESEDGFLFALQDFLESGDFTLYEDTLVALSKSYSEQSANELCRKQSLWLLRLFPSDTTQQFVVSKLGDEALSLFAAKVLRVWGVEWDTVAPILAENGHFRALGQDPRALPFLEAALASADPVHRFNAAMTLRANFGDSTYVLPLARETLALGSDSNYDTIKWWSMEVLKNLGNDNDIVAISEVARSDEVGKIRSRALDVVVELAQTGNMVALDQLELIRDSSVDMDVRQQAKYWFDQLK